MSASRSAKSASEGSTSEKPTPEKPVPGKSVPGKSVPGKSVSGKSASGKAPSGNKKPRDEAADDLALDTDLGWAIRLVSSAFRRVATASVTGLPGGARGYLVLVALAGGGEPPSQLALAREVSLDRTVMTYLLDDLESHKLVTRTPDPRDRRARQVVLTDAGRARLTEVRRSLAAAEARLLADLDDQDAEHLRTLLARVAQTAQREVVAPGEVDC